ncbi:hypothetical protein NDU88_003645 [Pleurodeles waltl]|uniref:Uncharacterized protein n=1 Tax=Pleurodeles waltl TaxID=8319 RepID=A0AAV7V0L6_PLEWA|nr:hypothetical protein NDU88_003645 [Pleurodeles waltl]
MVAGVLMVHCGPLPHGEPRTGFCLHQEGERHEEACWRGSHSAEVLTGSAHPSSRVPRWPARARLRVHCPCLARGWKLLWCGRALGTK